MSYWDIEPPMLYSRDQYYQEHMVDVKDTLEVGLITSVLATILIFVIGVVL